MFLKTGLERMCFSIAERAHRGQERHYTGDPYLTHPKIVARLVQSVTDDPYTISAALLHDVIEDTELSTTCLVRRHVPFEVIGLVLSVTNVSEGSTELRAVRKELDRAHFARGNYASQTIKIADVLHNVISMHVHNQNRKFVALYKQEAKALLDSLTLADPKLRRRLDRFLARHPE